MRAPLLLHLCQTKSLCLDNLTRRQMAAGVPSEDDPQGLRPRQRLPTLARIHGAPNVMPSGRARPPQGPPSLRNDEYRGQRSARRSSRPRTHPSQWRYRPSYSRRTLRRRRLTLSRAVVVSPLGPKASSVTGRDLPRQRTHRRLILILTCGPGETRSPAPSSQVQSDCNEPARP
jgi:hypothetical protein